MLSALAVIGLFAALWKWRGLAAMQPLVDGGMGRWTCAVLESIVITLAAQWVLCLLPWPLLALFGRRRPFCSVFSLRPCVGSKAELSRARDDRRAAAPARARRRGAVVRAGARAARVVLARGRWASAGCTVAALGMVYDAVRVLQVPGRATFCDLGIVIQVYREVS